MCFSLGNCAHCSRLRQSHPGQMNGIKDPTTQSIDETQAVKRMLLQPAHSMQVVCEPVGALLVFHDA